MACIRSASCISLTRELVALQVQVQSGDKCTKLRTGRRPPEPAFIREPRQPAPDTVVIKFRQMLVAVHLICHQ